MKPRSPWKIRLAATMLIVGLFVTVPPLRALATDILQQLGVLKITNAPTYLEQELANPGYRANLQPAGEFDGVGPIPSVAEMSAALGFPLYQPQQLPPWMVLYDRALLRANAGTDNVASVTAYSIPESRIMITLLQQPTLTSEIELPVGAAATQPVMVGSNEGVWIEHAAMTKSSLAPTRLGYNNVLMWNADGYLFTLSGNDDTSLKNMLIIAESLAPGQ